MVGKEVAQIVKAAMCYGHTFNGDVVTFIILDGYERTFVGWLHDVRLEPIL